MKIAIVHYHLKRGGVTSVIRHQVDALVSMGWSPLVLSGAPARTPLPAPVITIPELGYDTDVTGRPNSPDILANKILGAVKEQWPPKGADVVHVHNPTLIKNKCLQGALKLLQASDVDLLCQIHDFAEDGRPAAYQDIQYVGDCHYAAINTRDHRLLIQSGLTSRGCHLVANTVPPVAARQHRPPPKNMAIYPVRAIRRKNIGEALLLSVFLHREMSLAITLPPNSPADLAGYHQWRSFARRHNLSVLFEIGVDMAYDDLMAQGRYVLNTSITEGFGFVFLEPWVYGKALWGRRLPAICQGFVDDGVELSHLYSQLEVPLDWIDLQRFAKKWKKTYSRASKILCHPMAMGQIESAWHHVSKNGNIDFGLLDEQAQQAVIVKVLADSSAAGRLKQLNPFLERPGPPDNFDGVIQKNAEAVARYYHPDQYARRLKEVYTHVVQTPVEQRIDKSKLAPAFLTPSDFSLLKWGGK
jgi:hypothetical protein